MKKYVYEFDFYCERKLTQQEKMEIASKGLNALSDIVCGVVGEDADHNMSFGWGEHGDPYEARSKNGR